MLAHSRRRRGNREPIVSQKSCSFKAQVGEREGILLLLGARVFLAHRIESEEAMTRDEPTSCTHSFDDIETAWADGLCAYCLRDKVNRLRAQLAGVVEQCAKVCDEQQIEAEKRAEVEYPNYNTGWAVGAVNCARGIRALADPAAPKADEKADAERYRWIAAKGAEAKDWGNTHPTMEGCPLMPPGIVCVLDKTTLDSAIDTARGADREGKS